MKRRIKWLALFLLVMFLIPLKTNSVCAATTYLEKTSITAKGQYEGNLGDSFVYPIGKHQYTRGNVGIDGEYYGHGIEVWIARWNYEPEKSWAYANFKLGRKYTALTGYGLLIKSANTTNFDTSLYFYGDGKLLKKYRMSPSTMPFNISVDVTGVNTLKIYAEDNGYFARGTSFGLVNMALKDKTKINKCSISAINTQSYTGKVVKPFPIIRYNGKLLENGKDYSISYKNNIKPGTASIIVSGKGAFTGKRIIKFKIKKKANIKLSKSKVTLSLAGVRTTTLKAAIKNASGKVSWKSSDKSVVTVKDGRLTAEGRGKAKITAKIAGVTASCNVTVNDVSVRTISYSFKTLKEWKEQVSSNEQDLTFGNRGILPDGSTYHTGNIIVKRKVLSYKRIAVKVSINTPGYYQTVYLKLPKKVQYTLHRHNLKNDMSSESVGRLMAGVVNKQVVWTQKCSCGFENVLKWDIPIEEMNKLEAEETYTVNSTSLMID